MGRLLISWLLGLRLVLGACGGSLNDLVARGRAHEQALEETWTQQLDLELDLDAKTASQKSPVQRVVALLKEMKAQLESEADNESEMYDKITCWCTTNEKEKTKAIADAEAKITELEAAIQGAAAKKGQLATEIKALKEQIQEDEATLKTATEIRAKAAEAFSEEEKEMVQAITNLGNAVRVLSKHHGGSLLQLDSPTLASVRAVLQDVSLKYDLMQGDAPGARRKPHSKQAAALLSVGGEDGAGLDKMLLRALGASAAQEVLPVNLAEKFLSRSAKQASALVQAGAAPSSGSYSPQSGTIFGILQSMKEEFEANLSQAQKDELKERADFEELSKAKTEQIAVGKEKLDAMESEYAANEKLLSDGKEDLELTRQQRSSDVEFLSNLRLQCQDLDSQWAERSKMRGEELKAVAEAISILTEDDSRELLAKSVTLLQVATVADSAQAARRSRAASFLRQAVRSPDMDDLISAWNSRGGAGVHDPKAQLSTLAVSVELDSFTEVKAAMDKMIVDLKKQQEEEAQAKSNCQKEFADNEKITYEKTELKEDLEASMESLERKLESLASEIKAAKEEIAATKKAILEAGQTREKENKEFQTVVADQRATQAVLKKALKRLEQFYKKASLVQAGSKAVQTPPAQFTDYKKNAGSVSVMGLLEQIIEDSKKLEAETVAGESKAQAEYENFVKDSNGVVSGLEEQVLSKSKLIEASKVELEEASGDHQSTLEELGSLAEYLADLHMQCDFLMKNFDIRQKARLQEIESIQQAKAILSGASE